MTTHADLIADIDSCEVAHGSCAIWWLGQQSFVVKTASTVLYLDPFLTPLEGRTIAPLLLPSEVTNADLIFGSHDHADHIDRPAWPGIAAASPRARFLAPALLRERLAREVGIPESRLVGLDDLAAVRIGSVTATGIAAAHEFLDRDPASGRYPYLGCVFEVDGVTFFHAGDSCVYEGMLTKLAAWRYDIVFLPINGRCAKRLAAGCIGNMTYQEAADLAGSLAPKLTIPAHWDMFTMNSEDPVKFSDYMRVKYPHLAVTVMRHGERMMVAGRAAAPVDIG